MHIVKPPNEIQRLRTGLTIFLAGSIEGDKAEQRQKKAEKLIYLYEYKNTSTCVLNPRRDDWDSTWKEGSPELRAQIQWELNGLSIANYIIMYFDPATKSPISLLELGLYARSSKLMVVCPDGFYRKTNVEETCKFWNTHMFDTLEDAIKFLYQ